MRKLALVTILGAGLAACSSGTGPSKGGNFDAARVEAGVATVDRVGSTPAVASFMALAGQVGAVSPLAPNLRGADRLLAAVRQVARVTTPTGVSMVPVINPSALGHTYVYAGSSQSYVVDPNRSDAPANGVRFVLYEVNGEGTPNPSQPIGYADLTDVGAGESDAAALSLVVIANDVTYLSYRFDLAGSVGAASVHVNGFLSDGTDRVDFDITTTGQLFGQGGTATVDATIGVPSHDFQVTAHLSGPAGETTGDSHLELAVASGEDDIGVVADVQANQLNATFTVNDKVLATATGDPANPVIVGDGGRDLTVEERTALGAIVGFAGGVFGLIGDLLAPAGVLLLLGLGL